MIYLKLLAWPEVDEDVKKQDCMEAIHSVKFRQAVFAEAENINALNKLYTDNLDKILAFNQLGREAKKHPKWTNKIDIQLKDFNINLPNKIATSADSILNRMSEELIVGMSLYADGSILYSIYDPVVFSKPRNYRIYHNLHYNRKLKTNLSMGSELESLIKDTMDTSLGNTQYTIKVEPYMGW